MALMSISACKDNVFTNKSEVLAEFKEKKLYKSDIPEDVLNKFSIGDSNGLLNSYIDKWLENQVLLNAAEGFLDEEEKNNEQLINDYKNSLIVFQYQQKLIKEKLDTAVSESEILEFYNSNSSNFILKKNIVKIRYIKIENKNADVNKIKKLIQNPSEINDRILNQYAQEKAINFYLDSNWLFLDDITKEIPLDENYNQQRFLSNNKYIQLEENGVLYILYIIDFRIKNNNSPLEFEKENIKETILYKRKMAFLSKIQEDLYNNALEKGDIKYNNKK